MIKTTRHLNFSQKYKDYSPVLVVSDSESTESFEMGVYDDLAEAISKAETYISSYKNVSELVSYIESLK